MSDNTQTVIVDSPLPASSGSVPIASGTGRWASGLFGRNSARGPSAPAAISGAGSVVSWTAIESGAAAGPNVPVTTRVTGRIRIIASIGVVNNDNAKNDITVQAAIDGVASTLTQSKVTVPALSFAQIPFLLDVTGLTVGLLHNIEIQATQSGGSSDFVTSECTVDVQELPAPTG